MLLRNIKIFLQATRRHNSKDHNLHINRPKNLKTRLFSYQDFYASFKAVDSK
jgi:hypothetical protein